MQSAQQSAQLPRFLRPLAVLAAVGALVATGPAPAVPAQPAVGPPAGGSTLPTTSDSTAYPGDDFIGVRAASTADIEPRIETHEAERPVAPGVTLRSFDRYGPDGYTGSPTWLRADSLTVDLTAGTTVGYLFPGQVAAAEPLTEQADRAGAVAAVNGDFFDIDNSDAPSGVGVRDGELVQSPDTDPAARQPAAIFTPDGLGAIGQVFFAGTVALPSDQTLPLAGVNKASLAPDAVQMFTPQWGTHCRCRSTQGASSVTEVEVVDGAVTAVRDSAGDGPVPAGGFVLVGREAAAAVLAGLAVGDRVGVDYTVRDEHDQRIQAAVGGRQLLVVDGVAQRFDQGANVPAAPRTAVGFTADGRQMFVLSADGRQPAFAEGIGLDELARMMVELGAHHALNLDGGGSTTIVARKPGAAEVQLENSPSDGHQRPVPNGLGLFAPPGSGTPSGFWVETAVEPARASGATAVAPGHPDRVFPGLTRQLTAAGYDERYGPAAATPRWRSSSLRHGRVAPDGVFHAREAGRTTVTASDGRASGSVELTVLGPLVRHRATVDQLALAGDADSVTFGLVGYDRDGHGAPIEPADVRLSYDTGLLEITPGADGQFAVTALAGSGSTLVTAEVAGVESVLPVTVGFVEVTLADFEDPAGWTFFGERATGAVAPAPGRSGNGLRLTYDFTQTTQTRTGGALAPAGLQVPGQPRAFRLWVQSTGNGEWPSLQAWDGAGHLLPAMRDEHLNETGWRQLEFTVPPGTTYPLTLRRYYSAEIRSDVQYQGDLVIDELTALVPPDIEVPPAPVVTDPVVVQQGTVAGAPWRFAMLADAQFVARDPDSAIVRNTRRQLRQIRAVRPDFLLINGDFVDEASPADFALAKRILDEELDGALPYHYVPGNHERMDNSLANFSAEFGATQHVFDHNGTRFVTIDTSAISVRGSDWTQLRRLRSQLDAAAGDPAVRAVVVVQHVPPRDPTPAKASELNDRKEAATIERWLVEFRSASGKGVALLGAHVGTFHASRVDGVPYFINGNSGKSPSTRPEDGGFIGWTLWGVDTGGGSSSPTGREGWLRAEVRPLVEAMELTAPDTVPAGGSAPVTAAVTQDGRTVPVGYPVTAQWSGSPNLHIGDPRGVRPWHTAVFDPATGTLTALRASQVTVAVTVNDVTEQATVELTAALAHLEAA